jgi:hypothetical protein
VAARTPKNTPEPEEPNMEDLLAMTGDDVSTSSLVDDTPDIDAILADDSLERSFEKDELDEDDAELAALQAELSKPEIKPEPEPPIELRPTPEAELTPKQRQIRQLRDELAKKQARELEAANTVYDTSDGKERILINFVADGFTAQGVSWYRGQELEFVVGSQAYEQTKNRLGQSWLDLRDDEDAQYERYGEVKFRSGPWRGKRWSESNYPDATQADLAAAERKELSRRRAAPLMGTLHR